MSAPGTGFQHETNAVTIIGRDGVLQTVPLTDKRSVARALVDQVVAVRNAQPAGERRATDHHHEEHK